MPSASTIATPAPTTVRALADAISAAAAAEWTATPGVGRVYLSSRTRSGRQSDLGLIEITPDGRAVHYLKRDVRAITAWLAECGITLCRPE